LAEPFVDLHPNDAANLGIAPADLVVVSNKLGRAILRARITDSVAAGQIFAPMHWTGENAAAARIDTLVPAVVDPISGQPDSKSAAVSAQRYHAKWYGFAVCAQDAYPAAPYWARAKSQAVGAWNWRATPCQTIGLPMRKPCSICQMPARPR
jgi:assimilatory nitrate reductase catalytic subunit